MMMMTMMMMMMMMMMMIMTTTTILMRIDDVVVVGALWLIGRCVAFHLKYRGFEFRSSRHVETLDKSFTCSCLWRSGLKLRHSIRAVSGAPLSSSGLKEALYKLPE